MSFTNPLGLLGLIAIPIIIVIYILQSKYTEQTVTSTYLWQLSEKFLKKKNPLSGLTGIISLILQILTVTVVSLAIARPVFTLPGAANNYCFILDASSSMNMQEGRETRFEKAKDEIIDVIKDAKSGSSYSLICVSNETVTVFDSVTSKASAIDLINSTQASHTSAEYADLLGAAQKAFDKSSSSLIYLVTDKSYTKHENIEIIDVGTDDAENYAVFDVEYSHSGGQLNVTAKVISYTKAAEPEITLSVDGEKVASSTVAVNTGELTQVSFSSPCVRFDSFTVEVASKDGYLLDNRITTYNLESDKTYSTLIVSETGFFFEAVIDALVDSEVKTVTPEEYETVSEKYGLYIFDSYEPSTLPDGAVWLINADQSIENSGFGVRGKTELSNADVIEKSKSTATKIRNLLRGVDGSDIYITNYVKYSGMYLNFYTLFSYDSNPLIFAGENGLGNRQVVFGFDLHESDFALSTDFVMLLRNLLDYSFPNVIDKTNYTVGEDALINIVANAENLKVLSPSGDDLYIEADGTTATLTLDEVGTYVISMTLAGQETTYRIYSSANAEESKPTTEENEFSLSGERTYANIDGEYDPIMVLFICLAILFIADWGVYCYEKYQLR